jgi:hypothetical protein
MELRMTTLGKTFLALAVAILAVLMFVPAAHADSIVEINGQNIILGGETLNFTMLADLTTNMLVPGSSNFVWTGALNGSPFVLAPQCTASSTGLCSKGVSTLNFSDSSDGATLQIGIFDLSLLLGGPNVGQFPAVGVYSATLVDITCAFASTCFSDVGGGFVEGLGPSADGQIIVSGVPEPGIPLLLLVGLVGLVGALKFASGHQDAVTPFVN